MKDCLFMGDRWDGLDGIFEYWDREHEQKKEEIRKDRELNPQLQSRKKQKVSPMRWRLTWDSSEQQI